MIVGFSVSPFIVTLGMLSVAKGLSLLLTGGLPLYAVPDSLVDILGLWRGARRPDIEPRRVCGHDRRRFDLAQARSSAATFTRSDQATRRRAIPAFGSAAFGSRFMPISGAAAGLAAIVMTAWVSAAQPLAGEGMELQSIAAVVVGGVALAGGSGNMLQAFYGVLVLGLFRMR